MPHHLIFEGAELSGKSWLMSQVYNHLEPKYNQNKNILDGCHWFNCDVGVFGLPEGQKVIEGYISIFQALSQKNIIVEKFHLADKIYNKLYTSQDIDYQSIEETLLGLDFKIIFVTFPADIVKLQKRIKDRLNLYPHYSRILKKAEWYLQQQELYRQRLKKSQLPYLEIKTDELPDEKLLGMVLEWIGERN